MMNTQTFDLGTDNLLTDEPSVREWMKAFPRGVEPSTS